MVTVGTVKRPIADILADFNQPVDPNVISKKPIFKKGQKVGEVDYISWYSLIEFLISVCPGYGWECRSQYVPDRVVVEGRLTIRAAEGDFHMEAIGVEELDSNGYGDPCYSAEASALRRAMAKFGYGLDLWRREKKVESRNSKVESSEKLLSTSYSLLSTSTISPAQASRLYAIASKESGLSNDDVKTILKRLGYESSKSIPAAKYDEVVEKVRKTKFYSLWQSENDAIAWAMGQLPDMTMHDLNRQWRTLVPVEVDGKPSRAIAWVQLVGELKKVPIQYK